VEVGDEGVDQFKTVAGRDEQTGVALCRSAGGRLSDLRGGRFQGADAGRADCDHAIAAFTCPAYALERVGADVKALGMHDVFAEPLDADRLKRTGADMQRSEEHTSELQAREKLV